MKVGDGVKIYEQDPGQKKKKKSLKQKKNSSNLNGSFMKSDKSFFKDDDPSMRLTKIGMDISKNCLELK